MNSIRSAFTGSKLKSLRESFEPLLRSMRGGADMLNPGTVGNTPIGFQLIETFIIVIVFSLSMQLIESSFNELQKYNSMAVDIYPLTYNSSQIFIQDPTSCFPILQQSNDERNGIEYSYSCFVNLSAENFTEQPNTFRHVFHKGSPTIYPLMAPGVFFKANTNTLRVYQNSTLTWNHYVDIENIPVNKWFHLVVVLKGMALDVYINGNLANRKKFESIPKLNYGNFYLLNGSTVGDSNVTCSATTNTTTDTTNVTMNSNSVITDLSANRISNDFIVVGAMRGFVSRVKYYAFALTYAQIDKLLREGPSKKIFNSRKDPVLDDPNFSMMPNFRAKPKAVLPFYQTDDWWTSDNHNGLGPQ